MKCETLKCNNDVGPDGCFHDEERPLCSSCLPLCPECKADIDLSHEPFHVQAARHFPGGAA